MFLPQQGNRWLRLFFFQNLLIFVLSSITVLATTYYVDQNNKLADNGNPGTEALPWATLHRANMKVGPGDTVIVKAGIYHDWICPETNGTPDQWIVYLSDPPHKAILDGWVPLDSVVADTGWHQVSSDSGNIWSRKLISNAFTEAWMDNRRLAYPYPYPCDPLPFARGRSYIDSTGTLFVWLDSEDWPTNNHNWYVTLKNGVWLLPKKGQAPERYVEVNGFVTQRYGLNGICVSSNYVRIVNNISTLNGRSGIAVSFCNHVLVEGNEAFENCKGIGFTQGITAYHVFGKDIVFRRNVSHDNLDGADSLHCGTDGSGFVIDSCPPDAGAVLINNIAYNNMGSGFGVYQSSNVSLINNTSFNNFLKDKNWTDECHIIGTSEGPSNHIVFRNNILVAGQVQAPVFHVKYVAANPPEDVVFDHNLFFERGATDESKLFEITFKSSGQTGHWLLNRSEWQNFSFTYDSVTFEPHWGEGSLVADPKFQGWRSADFHLRESSPAIDAGNSELAPTMDFDGNDRPQGAGIDLGAYEFLPSTSVAGKIVPTEFSVGVYPNPFNSCLTIQYTLAQPARVQVQLYNILGEVRARLIDKHQPAGNFHYLWKGTDRMGTPLPSGLYVIRFQVGEKVRTEKILLLK